MDPETLSALYIDLKRDEGRRPRPYRDTREVWTVGYGHNLESGPSLTERVLQAILEDDVTAAIALLDLHCPWWRDLSPIRQRVICNMAFNLGPHLLEFHHTLPLMHANDPAAADAMMLSAWAHQVGARADRLSLMWRTDRPL